MYSRKVYIHEKGHPWPGQKLCLHIMSNFDENGVEPIENLCDGMETMNEICCLGDKLKTSGGCEAAVTARMRIA